MRKTTARRDFTAHPPGVMDRITYRACDGTPHYAYVAALRRRESDGKLIAWVEPEHDPSCRFHAIALADVIGSDNNGAARRQLVDEELWKRLALCEFNGKE